MRKINLTRLYRKYETGLEIFGFVLCIAVIVGGAVFACLPKSEYPIWLKNKNEQNVVHLGEKVSYYNNAARFYIANNPVKAGMYNDSAKSIQREIDSFNIFVIQKNEL